MAEVEGRYDRRLLSVDVVKGISIMGVLFIHPTIYGIWHTEALALETVNFWVVIGFIPIILMGTWGGGFPLISSLVNTYNVFNRLERGIKFRKAIVPILISSTILLLLDPLKGFLFGRTWTNTFPTDSTVYGKYNFSVLSHLLEYGTFRLPTAEKIFQIGSLPAIGLSGFMVVFLLWILFRNGGRKKTKRNVIILISIGLVWAGINNFVCEWTYDYIGVLFLKGGIFTFFAYILRLFFGAQLSFFPMGIYAIFGMVGGYLVAQKKDIKWIKRYGYGFGSLFLGGFVITTAITLSQATGIEAGLFGILDYEIYPRELFFLSIGCMMFILVFLVKKFEYTSSDNKIRLAKKTAFIRRFGVATLTIYFFEPLFNGIFPFIFHRLFGGPVQGFGTADLFMTNVGAIFLYEFVIFAFWGLGVYFWSKTGYKFGLEHLIIVTTRPLRKVKTKRLQLYIPSKEELDALPEKKKRRNRREKQETEKDS